MKLTRKKAIELCIELWTWLAETGKQKKDWPEWEKYHCHIVWHCWLCYYCKQRGGRPRKHGDCSNCPYYEVYGFCAEDKKPYYKWTESKQKRTRKKYAKLFAISAAGGKE
jgi:hypothetical protein